MSSRRESETQESVAGFYKGRDSIRSEPLSLFDQTSENSAEGGLEKTSYVGDYDDVFDDLTDAEVLEQLAEVETEARHWDIENDVFWWYLENNDPSLLLDVPDMVEKATFLMFGDLEEIQDQTRVRSSKISFGSVASILQGRVINVNLVQKSDMVLKASEVKQAALKKFLKRSHITKRNMLSELEEFRLRDIDITGAKRHFEYRIVTEAVDSLTQRIPAEKFLKYMYDWLRFAGSDIEKLRLRTAHMRLLYKKACALLVSRQELAENLHAVDFDRLIIENGRLSKEYETKMIFMMETKTLSGASNRALNLYKKHIMDLQVEQEDLRKQLTKMRESSQSIERECLVVQEEVTRAKKAYSEFLYIADNFRVPDVMKYVNMKKEYSDIQHETKLWQRKKKVLDISLRASIKEMMNLTGAKQVKREWFEDPREPVFIDEAVFNNIIDPHKSSMKHFDQGLHGSHSTRKKSVRTISSMIRSTSKFHLSQSSLDPSRVVGRDSKVGIMSEEVMSVML